MCVSVCVCTCLSVHRCTYYVLCVYIIISIQVLCVYIIMSSYMCCVCHSVHTGVVLGIGKLSGVGYCDVGPLSAFFHAYINILVMCVCILIVCMTEWYVFLVVCLYVNLMCMC